MDAPFYFVPSDSEIENAMTGATFDTYDTSGDIILLPTSPGFSDALMSNTVDPTLISSGTLLCTSAIATSPITTTQEGLLAESWSVPQSELYCNTTYPESYVREPSPIVASDDSSPVTICPNEEDPEELDSDDQTSNERSSTKKSFSKRSFVSTDKKTHNIIEKRYRTKLNNKISTLRDSIPSLKTMGNAKSADKSKKKRVGVAEDLHCSVLGYNITKACPFFTFRFFATFVTSLSLLLLCLEYIVLSYIDTYIMRNITYN